MTTRYTPLASSEHDREDSDPPLRAARRPAAGGALDSLLAFTSAQRRWVLSLVLVTLLALVATKLGSGTDFDLDWRAHEVSVPSPTTSPLDDLPPPATVLPEPPREDDVSLPEEKEEVALTPRKANATLLILVSPRAKLTAELFPTLRNVEASFNARLGYPYQLLTDGELPSEEMQAIASEITGGKTTWSLMTAEDGWTAPDWISQEDIDKSIEEIPFPLGYRHMCRFYSGFFWKHPAVARFEYIWRLDEGVKFWCDLDYDPFLVMKDNGKRIGYSVLRTDNAFVNVGLWEATKAFLTQNPQYVAEKNNAKLVTKDGGETWNNRIIYNNFEISHRSIWESEAYSAYFDHIDHVGGIYRVRWGDAPIHTLALAYILPASEWISFADTTGYQHGKGAFVCPKLPQCSCVPKDKAKGKAKGGRGRA